VRGQDVVLGHAVQDRVGTGGVVADDAADGGAVGAGRVGAEHQAVAGQLGVELGKDDTGLHTSHPRARVNLQDLVEVFRGIDYERCADRLPGQAAAPAAR